MSQAPEPLKLIREWLAGVKLSWIRPATASLAVAGRPLFDYDPETGAEFIVVATAHVGMVIGRRGRLGVILFNPMADLLSDRALRTVLAHEILHLTGILWEDEADRLLSEAARLRPDLLAAPEEVSAEVREKLIPLVEGVDIWREYVIPPPEAPVRPVGEEVFPSFLHMVSVSLPIISCAGV